LERVWLDGFVNKLYFISVFVKFNSLFMGDVLVPGGEDVSGYNGSFEMAEEERVPGAREVCRPLPEPLENPLVLETREAIESCLKSLESMQAILNSGIARQKEAERFFQEAKFLFVKAEEIQKSTDSGSTGVFFSAFKEIQTDDGLTSLFWGAWDDEFLALDSFYCNREVTQSWWDNL